MGKRTFIKSSIAALAFLAGGFLSAAADAADRCNCRFFGQSYQQEAQVCLRTPDGHRIARCSLVLNNSSWIVSEQRCQPGAAVSTLTSPLSIAQQLSTAEAFKRRLRAKRD